jgi:dUTP pyrophosphatase
MTETRIVRTPPSAVRRAGGWDRYRRDVALQTELDRLEVRLLRDGAALPARTRPGDAGYDLRAAEPFALAPGERATVGTGIALALPAGVAGLVVPRSGLAARHGISVVNGPGLVDPNYRGELRVVLVNLGEEPFAGEPGDRIAQLLLVPYLAPDVVAVDALPASPDDRGELGFGSSGR